MGSRSSPYRCGKAVLFQIQLQNKTGFFCGGAHVAFGSSSKGCVTGVNGHGPEKITQQGAPVGGQSSQCLLCV